jgi:hypothetical protein
MLFSFICCFVVGVFVLFAQKRKIYVSLIDSLARGQVDKFRTKFHADDEA